MGCFDGLVSIRGLCDPVDPRSLIYLDDVGITLTDTEDFMTSQYSSGGDYFLSRTAFAVKEIEALIYNYFNDQFKATSLVDDHRLGIYTNDIATAVGSDYMGIQLEFNPTDVYFKFEVSEVSLRLNYSGVVDVGVYDLRQNKLLNTLPITAVSGEIVTGYLNELYYSSKNPLNLFMGYNATGIPSVKTSIKDGLCCGKKHCSNSFVSASGVKVAGTFHDSNITTLDHTGGLSIVYSIQCDHSAWMCAYARSMALPIAYKTAAIMVSDALYNTGGERSTNSHTVNFDELKKRYDFYSDKFKETFTSILTNMRLPNNRCFHCNTPISHKPFAL